MAFVIHVFNRFITINNKFFMKTQLKLTSVVLLKNLNGYEHN